VKHPGAIVLVDEDKGTKKTAQAKDVPPSVAFVNEVPVVRVVARRLGEEREVQSYGADGALLSSTLMRK
jgi:hypothetical protein